MAWALILTTVNGLVIRKIAELIKVGGAREAAWGKFDRIDSNGVSTEYYLCPEHKTKYQELVQQEDKDFQAWLNGVDE